MVGPKGTHRDLLATACQQVIPKRGSCLAYRCRPDVISHIWTGWAAAWAICVWSMILIQAMSIISHSKVS